MACEAKNFSFGFFHTQLRHRQHAFIRLPGSGIPVDQPAVNGQRRNSLAGLAVGVGKFKQHVFCFFVRRIQVDVPGIEVRRLVKTPERRFMTSGVNQQFPRQSRQVGPLFLRFAKPDFGVGGPSGFEEGMGDHIKRLFGLCAAAILQLITDQSLRRRSVAAFPVMDFADAEMGLGRIGRIGIAGDQVLVVRARLGGRLQRFMRFGQTVIGERVFLAGIGKVFQRVFVKFHGNQKILPAARLPQAVVAIRHAAQRLLSPFLVRIVLADEFLEGCQRPRVIFFRHQRQRLVVHV